MSETKLRRTKMAKTCPLAAPTMMSALRVLSMFRSASRRNNGTRLAIIGIIIRIRMAFQNNEESGILSRAKKYAAHSAKQSVITVVLIEMKMLLATVGVTSRHASDQFSVWIGWVITAGAS